MAKINSAPRMTSPIPLRVALAVLLSVLLVIGSRLNQPVRTAGAINVTSTTHKSGGGHVTTTTINVAAPVTNPVPVHFASHGCNLSTVRATTPTGLRPLGRCTVLEIGDSVGNNLAWGLGNQLGYLHNLNLIQKGKPSTGLSNSWFYDWVPMLHQFLAQYHPQLVIVMLGANDEQGMYVNGHPAQFGTPVWERGYRAQILKIVTEATHAGSQVLWVGMPVCGPVQYNRGMQYLDAQYRRVAPSVPGVTYLPTWRLFATAGGSYRGWASVNHQWVGLRHPDGIHFSYIGEQVLATFATHQISAIYHVRLHPSAPALITG